ncbi:MAG TPA: NAD(P)H-binding protein [Microlunatus sp.]|nr:NAD(P)H-binding protein [Microlunatus sp.]
MTTIALTGAAGQLGRLVAEQLLDQSDPADIVVITRRPEAVADLVARGATVREADFDSPDTLVPAFTGVDRLLIISADTVGDRLEGQLAAVAAAKEAAVGHVFYTSVTEPTADNPAGVVPDHRATEEALAASGLRWTSLRNNLYAEFQLPTLQQAAASGQLVTNAGAGLTAYVTRTDCASAAAAALLLPEPAQIYDITGPDGVSTQDLAALAGTLGDKPVEVVDVTDEEFVAGLVAAGLPEPVGQLFASFGTATREGFLGRTSTAVADLTGRQPTPLAALVG